MKNWLTAVIVIVLFYACKQEKRIQYPVTKKVDTTDVYFGMKVPDPYRWLEDDNSEETKAWVKAQNEVTSGYLKKIPFREKIRERFTKMWNYERQSFLKKESGIYYFDGNNGLQNQNVIYYKKSLDSESKVLLDPNTLSKDGTSALNTSAISSDGKYFAYAISKSGSDWSEIFIKEIETGKLLSDHLLWVKFSGISWDKEGIYYSRYDEPKENKGLTQKNEFQKVYYHKLGTDQKDDKLIIKSDEPTVMYGAQVTEDRNYLIVYESKWGYDGNKIFIKEIASKKEFKAIGTGYENEYSVAGNWGSTFYIVTNASAPKRKVVSWDLNGKGEPVTVIPEKDYLLEGVALNGANTIIAQYLKDAHTKIEIYDAKGAYQKDMKLPALGTVAELSSRAGEKDLIYTFTSFTYPTASYIYDIDTDQSKVFFTPKIDFNPDNYETKQIFYTSKDGTKVPMFVVHKKGIELNGKNPTLLYAYGGFNVNITPSFSIPRLVWLENGGVYVSANIRGGGEYGKAWHDAGTKLNKQNVFDDFISAAEYLVQHKYTSPDKLAVMGGSNGGLLIGAVVNQRPDLFGAAIPMVGVMDMLRFHKFTIGGSWVSDFGSSDDSTQFRYIYKYSPLHNISDTAHYPAILVTTGDHDDR
ncbi:MAG TPA: prolyl oligopeptidase family serine peptidase, partial [Bacteroidales bacterium]|nr:prolyl oligopeptidase family serine peptidase [Bacteroidales bacterium]